MGMPRVMQGEIRTGHDKIEAKQEKGHSNGKARRKGKTKHGQGKARQR